MSKSCETCQGFITDWLELPLSPGELHILRHKIISANAQDIAKQIFRVYASVPRAFRTHVEISQKSRLRGYLYMKNIREIMNEGMDGEALLDAIEFFGSKQEMGILSDMLETACFVKKEVVRRWLGEWFIKLWHNLDDVHMEHQGLAKASYAGAAHGMCRVQKTIGGGTIMIPPVYGTSLTSLLREPSLAINLHFLDEEYNPYD
jgi:hypothetical protein